MFSTVLLCSLLVLSSCSEIDDKVFRNLLRLCPEQYVPTDNGTAVNHTSESGSCCTDYFNQSSKRMLHPNTINYSDSTQSCLFPTTDTKVPKEQTRKSFYMITIAPEDGCVISDNSTVELTDDFNEPTCNDSEVIPFRRFLPVYSKSSGFIYKNPQCAYCHGQYELTDWKAYASCFIHAPFEYDRIICKLDFVYAGPADDIQHLECFTEKFNACPDGFADRVNIPSNVDLSVNELAEACSMDNLPRFEDVHFFSKNVFCHVCHYCYGPSQCSFTECQSPDIGPPQRGLKPQLIRILDSRVINKNLHVSHQRETICGLESNVQICHDVLCPQGQLMTKDEESMKCQMDSTRWEAVQSKFVMWLLLDFDNTIAINDVALNRILTQNRGQNPWQASWNINAFYRPFARNIDMAYANGEISNMSNVQIVDSFSHAYVQLSYKRKSVNPATFVRGIEQILQKTWSFKMDNKVYIAKQAFSKYTLTATDKGVQRRSDLPQYGVPFWQLCPELHPHERVLYKAVVKEKLPRHNADVTRLLFCRQVELPSTHFEIFIYGRRTVVALLTNQTGKYLFDNEFKLVIATNSDRKYRICIPDTAIRSAAIGRGKTTNCYWLLIAVIYRLLV